MKQKIARIVLLVLVACLSITMISCKENSDIIVIDSFEEGYEINPQGKIKATTYLRSGEESEKAFDNWIKAYNKVYPNVVVKPDIIAWSDFGTRIAAGDIGDVYYGCEGNVYSYAVVNRCAMGLDAYVELLDIDVSQVFSGLYELGCANGYLYMVPGDLCPAVYFTNVSLLRESGIDMPGLDWTYSDFVEICRQVQRTDADGTYSQIGLSLTSAFEQLVPYLTGWGGTWVDPINKKVNLASDENVLKGLSELIDLIEKGYACVGGITGEVGARFANISSPANYAFTMGTYVNRITNKATYDELGLDMNVTCIPEMPRRTIYGGCTGFFVYSKTKNPDAAATFALFLLQDEGQRAFNGTIGGGVPTTKNCYEDDFWKIPYSEEEFNYDAFTCYPDAFVGNWPEVYVPTELCATLYNFAATWLSRHFNNVKDYTDTLAETEQTCNELWASIYTK